jgi:hypothetical protein
MMKGLQVLQRLVRKIMVQLNWIEKLLAMIKKRKGAAKYN